MRINHNIPALNTYRQLTNNNTNSAKAIEKLSSGLRINRAGDDAAGLAISEKMRAQIRGLDQASRNAQDGISMVQTAEGALSETHSILQRMRELANQAANDTNVSVDRDEIQKEINQLSSEINRIGNSTEFNTQKLLNGGGVEKELAVKELRTGAAAGQMGSTANMTTATATAAEWILSVGAATSADSVAEFKFNGVTVRVQQTSTSATSPVIDADSKLVSFSVSTGTTAAVIASAVRTALEAYQADSSTFELDNFTITSTAAATLKVAASSNTNIYNDLKIAETNLVAGGASSTVSASTSGSHLTTTSMQTAAVTIAKSSTAAVAAEWATDISNLATFSAGNTATITFNGVTVAVSAATAGGSAVAASATDGRNAAVTITAGGTTEEFATALANAFKQAQNYGGTELADFTFSVRGNSDQAKFVITDKASNGDYNNNLTLGTSLSTSGTLAFASTVKTTAGVDEVRGEYLYEISKGIEANGATVTIAGKTFTAVSSDVQAGQAEFAVGSDPKAQAISLAAALNADSVISARFDVTVDGGSLKFTEKQGKAYGADLKDGFIANNTAIQGQYAVTVDEVVQVGGKYTIDGVDIEVTDDASNAGLANGTAILYDATKNGTADKLTQAIKANAALNGKYDVSASGNLVTLTQKTGSESIIATEGSTNTSKAGQFEAAFQIGANTNQSLTISIGDMRSQALGITGEKSESTVKAKNGSEASYVKAANVSNGTSNTSTEFALDVSTHEKASAAVSVINDAIEKVSAQRSQLGAFQNRLEHTINNLETSSENLTAAESRIRDVDMAKEMMNQTKNSILAQAAQAMLAQANQTPQGVLQLLR